MRIIVFNVEFQIDSLTSIEMSPVFKGRKARALVNKDNLTPVTSPLSNSSSTVLLSPTRASSPNISCRALEENQEDDE